MQSIWLFDNLHKKDTMLFKANETLSLLTLEKQQVKPDNYIELKLIF